MPRSTPPPSADGVTLVMPFFDRLTHLEDYLEAGHWTDAPLLVVDDGSVATMAADLDQLAEEHGFTVHHHAENQGVAAAIGTGIRETPTGFFALVGDDDYLVDGAAFLDEAEATWAAHPDALGVVMPEMHMFQGYEQRLQYDRRRWDGATGRELLAWMVQQGEMQALATATVFRRDDLLEILPEPLFRMANDFATLCRLCARYPDRRLHVAESGQYMRLVHDRSITAPKRFTPEKIVMHLLALSVGGHHLITLGGLDRAGFVALIRQRGQVLEQVYNLGQATATLFASILEGQPPAFDTEEAIASATYLRAIYDELPPECVALFPGGTFERIAPPDAPAFSFTPAADQARLHSFSIILGHLQAERLAETHAAIAAHESRFPDDAELAPMAATLAMIEGDFDAAERVLATAAVAAPEHFPTLSMLGQFYLEQDRLEPAAALLSRALHLADEQQMEHLAPAWQRLIDHGITEPLVRPKLAFIVRHDLMQFLGDITRELVADYEVRLFPIHNTADVDAAMEWGDVCWFEWCNDPLVYGSRHPLARKKKILCRLHRYEAFSGYPAQVAWENVDRLLLVTGHLQHVLEASLPGLSHRVEMAVVHNGVNMGDYPLEERAPGFHLAYIGYVHLRKNPMLLLQIMARLVEIDDRYQLSLAGKFQDPLAQLYWEHMVKAMGLTEHVHFDGWQTDIAGWLADKQYLLSTSIHESFGYAIAEGMARGLKPVVHNFPFAHEIWAEEMLFNTVEEAVEMVASTAYDSAMYRRFVENQYALEKQMALIRTHLGDLTEAPAAHAAPAAARTTPAEVFDPAADLTVVIPTYNRSQFFLKSLAEGKWDGIRIHMVCDGCDESVVETLRTRTENYPVTLFDEQPNRGVAHAIGVGVRSVETSHYMFCGDDDFNVDYAAFLAEAAALKSQNDDVLFVTMPEIVKFGDNMKPTIQYDRRVFDGWTGQKLLDYLAKSGEMHALVAGSLFRTPDVVPCLPEPFFRVSEDFVLLARLCARHPERKVYVTEAGLRMRRIHAQSLSAKGGFSPTKALMNLVSMVVAGSYQTGGGTPRQKRMAIILQRRGLIFQQKYGFGKATANLVATLLQDAPVVPEAAEAQASLAYLQAHHEALPPEFLAMCSPTARALLTGIEDAVAEDAVAEDAVAEDAVAEDAVAEDAVAEDAVAEDAVAEDAVAEDAVAEDMIAEDAVAEDAVAEDAVAEDVLAEDVVAEDVVAEDAVAEDVVAEDAVAEEAPSRGYTATAVPLLSARAEPVEIKHFFVGGGARTGTTLLQILLCQAETTNPMVPEAHFLRCFMASYRQAQNGLAHQIPQLFDDEADFRGVQSEMLAGLLTRTRTRFPGTQHLVLKDPEMTKSFPDLFALDPHARFLCMVRDPRDVVASLLKVGEKMLAEGRKDFVARATAARAVGKLGQYLQSFYEPLAACEADAFWERILFVRYEDLVTNPDGILAEIATFTGLDLGPLNPAASPDTGAVDFDARTASPWFSKLYGKGVSAARVGTYTDALSLAEIGAVELACADLLSLFGYQRHAAHTGDGTTSPIPTFGVAP